MTPQEQADEWAVTAREHWTAGRLTQAAAYNSAAWEMDVHGHGAECSRRRDALLEAAKRLPLAEQTSVRLAAYGIRHDDPCLAEIREHNAMAMEKELGE